MLHQIHLVPFRIRFTLVLVLFSDFVSVSIRFISVLVPFSIRFNLVSDCLSSLLVIRLYSYHVVY